MESQLRNENDHPSYGVRALAMGLRRAAVLGPRPASRERQIQNLIVTEGGAPGWRVEDWLVEVDMPWALSARWKCLCPLAGIRPETLYWLPRARATSTWGGEGLSLVAVATLAVHLARWGLVIDPGPLVDAALPGIKGKGLLSKMELDLHWWSRERGGMRDVVALGGAIPPAERGVIDELPSGFRAAAHSEGLLIASPRVGIRKWRLTLGGVHLKAPPVEMGRLPGEGGV